MQYQRRRCSENVYIIEPKSSNRQNIAPEPMSYRQSITPAVLSELDTNSNSFVTRPHSINVGNNDPSVSILRHSSSSNLRIGPYTGYDWKKEVKQQELPQQHSLLRKNGSKNADKPCLNQNSNKHTTEDQNNNNNRSGSSSFIVNKNNSSNIQTGYGSSIQAKRSSAPNEALKVINLNQKTVPTATNTQRDHKETAAQQKPLSPEVKIEHHSDNQKLLEEIKYLRNKLHKRDRKQKQLESEIVQRDRKVSELQRDKFILGFRIESVERENKSLIEECEKMRKERVVFEMMMKRIETLERERAEIEEYMIREEEEWNQQKERVESQTRQMRENLNKKN